MTDHQTVEATIRLGSKKTDFNDTYDRLTPEAYYCTLRGLDYRLPELARPLIKRCLEAIRRIRDRSPMRVIDLCCGYGVNAALLNHKVDMDDLYDRYAKAAHTGLPAETVIERDRRLFALRRHSPMEADVIGVDVAANALSYARDAGLLSEALPLNLERDNPDAKTRALFRTADLVTVTGGLSYIGPASFERLLDCFPAERRPWVVWFPLRQTNVDRVTDTLARFGLKTEWLTTLPQRRMTDARERQLVLRQLKEAGLDPKDKRAGYLHAVCAISRPEPSIRQVLC
jgi:SAM-dependent methyltransferase